MYAIESNGKILNKGLTFQAASDLAHYEFLCLISQKIQEDRGYDCFYQFNEALYDFENRHVEVFYSDQERKEIEFVAESIGVNVRVYAP